MTLSIRAISRRDTRAAYTAARRSRGTSAPATKKPQGRVGSPERLPNLPSRGRTLPPLKPACLQYQNSFDAVGGEGRGGAASPPLRLTVYPPWGYGSESPGGIGSPSPPMSVPSAFQFGPAVDLDAGTRQLLGMGEWCVEGVSPCSHRVAPAQVRRIEGTMQKDSPTTVKPAP